MARIAGAVSVMVVLVALGAGCKQKPKEEEPSAAPPAAVAPVATAAPAAASPPEPDIIPPPVQPTSIPAPAAPKPSAKAESIAPCCSALHKEAMESAKDKGLYQTAASSCDAIAKLVSSGTTKKAAALTQLRANLRGAKLPAGCE